MNSGHQKLLMNVAMKNFELAETRSGCALDEEDTVVRLEATECPGVMVPFAQKKNQICFFFGTFLLLYFFITLMRIHEEKDGLFNGINPFLFFGVEFKKN